MASGARPGRLPDGPPPRVPLRREDPINAIILAAGEGVRLRPHTLDRPKCLVPLAGRPLLEYQVETLRRTGIRDISLVTGYQAACLDRLGFPTYHNADYARTNMVASLMAAAALFDGRSDLLIAYSDIVYEPRVVETLLAAGGPLATTVDLNWRALWSLRMEDPLADAETMKLGPGGDIIELGRKPRSYQEIEGQYMGLTRIRADQAPRVLAAWHDLRPDSRFPDPRRIAMTDFLQHLIDHGLPLRAATVRGGWLEVDSLRDLERYEDLHRAGRLPEFWRHPGPP